MSEWVPVPGYPQHPPLGNQELIGLEAMGKGNIPLTNYEGKPASTDRELPTYRTTVMRRVGDEERFEYHFYGDYISDDKVGNDKVRSRQNWLQKIQKA